MLPALKARMQAMRERHKVQRKKAIAMLEIAHAELALKHDIELAIVNAELQMVKNRRKDR